MYALLAASVFLVRFVVFAGVVLVTFLCIWLVIVGFVALRAALRTDIRRLGDRVLLGKVRLLVKVRGHGARIESLPLKDLVLLAGFRTRRWSFEDGWLILEAFW